MLKAKSKETQGKEDKRKMDGVLRKMLNNPPKPAKKEKKKAR